jgi:hypothetical protein
MLLLSTHKVIYSGPYEFKLPHKRGVSSFHLKIIETAQGETVVFISENSESLGDAALNNQKDLIIKISQEHNLHPKNTTWIFNTQYELQQAVLHWQDNILLRVELGDALDDSAQIQKLFDLPRILTVDEMISGTGGA